MNEVRHRTRRAPSSLSARDPVSLALAEDGDHRFPREEDGARSPAAVESLG